MSANTTLSSDHRPTVSAVITAYNSADYIHRSIESALGQTYRLQEIVIVDDGSSDETANVIRERFGERVRVISQENTGPNGARNRGARETTGEWIAFLDGDDTWLSEKIEAQIPFTSNPKIGLISCFAVNQASHARCEGEITFKMMWKQNYVGVPTALIRRTAFEELGGFTDDRNLVGAEDYNMWVRFAHSHWKVWMVPRELYNYTSAPGSLWSQKDRCFRGELLNIDKLRKQLGLSEDLLEEKRVEIYHNYGRDYLALRELKAARHCLATELRSAPSVNTALCWLATFVPTPLLDLRRGVMNRLRRQRVHTHA